MSPASKAFWAKIDAQRAIPCKGDPSTFYAFGQNNSGGSFHYDNNLGEQVIIEARSVEEANARFKAIGGYFDGIESGQDCECCGPRWREVGEWGRNWPTEQEMAAEFAEYSRLQQYVVHFLDGRVEWHNKEVKF